VPRSAAIEKGKPQGRGRDKCRNATGHLQCDNYDFVVSWQRCCSTTRQSRGRLPGQSFKLRNQMLECFEIADCCHRPDVQPIKHRDELRISNRFGEGVHLPDSSSGTFHRLCDIRLQLRVGDGVGLLRSRDTPQYLSVNWIAENAPKAFDLARDSLIDGPPLDCRGVWAGCGMALNRRTRLR